MRKIILLLALLISSVSYADAQKPQNITVIKVQGIINPIMSSYIIDSISDAEKNNISLVILAIDTPGGLLESTRDIIQKMINSTVPVVGYVYPKGGRAASAGAFIMYASDIAAMTPTSHIGAAHPVGLGQKIDSTMESKIVNDTVAYIEELAKRNKRNPIIAKQMVSKSISISFDTALKEGVVDHIAEDIPGLLKKIDNKKIIKNNRVYIIKTKDAVVKYKNMTLIEAFLYYIANPNIAYILLMLGIYGLIAEFSAPGFGFPGIFGAISLILAFFSLSNLPINLAGLLLIILALILFIVEIKAPTHGVLGTGAVVSFLLGSLMLMRSPSPIFKISLSTIITMTLFTAGFFFLIISYGIKAQLKKVTTGAGAIIGQAGKSLTGLDPEGEVMVRGEMWRARSVNNTPIKEGEKIEVVDIKNLTLIVKEV